MSDPFADLCRGAVDIHQKSELEERLKSGKRLRVKAGFDPTRPDLHLGHTVLMQKLRQFQDFGHEIVFIVGDFTAMVGDPTGKSELRPRLSKEEVMEAAKTYQEQAFKVLDRERTVVRYNSEWLDKLKPSEFVELGAKYTVARMLERDDFSKRYADGRPIFVHEFMYPLLQAYDSVVLDCDIELGGTDQLFNLLVGRDIMPRYNLRAQMVMTTPILEGLHAKVENGKVVGAKMSKSANNYVAITEPPSDMFNKLMVVDDQVIWRYMDLLSKKSTEELKALREDVASGKRGIIETKEDFAEEIVTRFHSAEAAKQARARRHEISRGDVPDELQEFSIAASGESLLLANALHAAGLATSSSEGRRMLKAGTVQLDGEQVRDDRALLTKGKSYVVRTGGKTRKFVKIIVG